MIFLTGDTHSDIKRFSSHNFPEQQNLTKNDYVIILGDFGLVWDLEESKYEKYWLDWLDTKPFTTLFLDGNHENHKRLHTYPSESWKGGRIHRLRNSVIHLMRGYVYNLQGMKFFVFGGARSHDIEDGILEVGDPRIKQWSKNQGYFGCTVKRFRVKDVSWWEEEMPSEKERLRGLNNLAKCNNKVDYILTHDLPSSSLTLYGVMSGKFIAKPDLLEDYLEHIKLKVHYKQWFCGHYHDERLINGTERILYESIIPLN